MNEKPNQVQPAPFTAATISGDELEIQMPKMSVVALEVV